MRRCKAQVFKARAVEGFGIKVGAGMAFAHFSMPHGVVDIDIEYAVIAAVLPDLCRWLMTHHRGVAQQAAGYICSAANQIGGKGKRAVAAGADNTGYAQNKTGKADGDKGQTGNEGRRGVFIPLLP